MKQTIEEAANDYLQKILEASDFEINFEEDNYDAGVRDAVLDVTERAFKAGAEWQAKQSPWISVKERLPEEGQKVFVLVIRYGVPSIREEKFRRNSNLDRKERWIHGNSIVLAWMPIPSFDQILEANKDVLQRIKEK